MILSALTESGRIHNDIVLDWLKTGRLVISSLYNDDEDLFKLYRDDWLYSEWSVWG